MTAPLSQGMHARNARASTPSDVSSGLHAEVLHGLTMDPKTLPPKLFYDADGATLFERITELPEYYLTRAELEVVRACARDIATLAGDQCALIEYGSGAGVKVRLLLDAFASENHPITAYVPIDISRGQLAAVASRIAEEYPMTPVHPVCADYTAPLHLPDLPQRARRVAFFPGSTIGNFHPIEASVFLRRVRRTVADDGVLVLGVDRRKDAATLDAAYDDAAGVTAAFNLNMLRRLNRELDADFDLERFRHRAFFNEAASRVEMHLVSLESQVVYVAGERVLFEKGESIWTESSYKYDLESLDTLVTSAGFRITRLWTDAAERFWVAYLDAA